MVIATIAPPDNRGKPELSTAFTLTLAPEHGLPDDVAVLDDLLQAQDGVLARQQAYAAGLSPAALRARLDAGRWQRVLPRVYAAFSGPVPRPSYLWAVSLWAGRDALLSHETAAELDQLIDQPAPVVHVTVPKERTVRAPAGIVVHRSRRVARVAHPAKLPPRTRIAETVLDLTQTARTIEDAYGWITRGISRRLTTVELLLDALERRQRMRWRRLLQEGLGDVAVGCRSVLELSYLRLVERAHGLPGAQRQVEVARRGGQNFLDVRYGRYRTRVELDGRAWHPFEERFRDMHRDNAGVVLGDAPLRYGIGDVTGRPCEVAGEVASVLRHRGWPDTPHACQRPDCVLARA